MADGHPTSRPPRRRATPAHRGGTDPGLGPRALSSSSSGRAVEDAVVDTRRRAARHGIRRHGPRDARRCPAHVARVTTGGICGAVQPGAASRARPVSISGRVAAAARAAPGRLQHPGPSTILHRWAPRTLPAMSKLFPAPGAEPKTQLLRFPLTGGFGRRRPGSTCALQGRPVSRATRPRQAIGPGVAGTPDRLPDQPALGRSAPRPAGRGSSKVMVLYAPDIRRQVGLSTT